MGLPPEAVTAMDAKKRSKYGLAGSVAVHVVLLLVLAASGIFAVTANLGGITEITVFGGGGGGGGSGAVEAAAVQQQAALPQNIDSDAITESRKEKLPQVQPAPQQAAKKQAAVQGHKGGTGSGGGKGTGHGTGTGSGTGAGTGSGSGGGQGSGHGKGVGAGIGDGITTNPVVAPKILRSVSPVYPETQRLTGVTGTVRLRLLIGTDGVVESVSVVTSSGSRPLDNAAVNACQKWRFAAAKNEAGQKVRCYWEIPIRFDLNH